MNYLPTFCIILAMILISLSNSLYSNQIMWNKLNIRFPENDIPYCTHEELVIDCE